MNGRNALRRTLHISSVSVLLAGSAFGWESYRAVVTGLAIALGIGEAVRLMLPRFGAFMARAVPVYRDQEGTRPSGAFWLMVGYAVAAWVPQPWTAAPVLVAGLGDPAASLIGSRWASDGRKTLQGSTAMLAVAAGAGLAAGLALTVALGLGVTAAILERWSGPIDDNLTVPVGAAVFLSIVG